MYLMDWGDLLLFIKKTTFITITIILFTIMGLALVFMKGGNLVPVLTRPSTRLPIIMYHNVSKNPKLLGKYTITPKEFEQDLIYIKEQGYTTIGIEDLIAFVYNDIKLPEKPIMLTFDDGYANMYRYVYPLLKQYNNKAVISIVGEYVEKSSINNLVSEPYLNWTQINELINSNLFEVQSHSYSMHKLGQRNGCRINKGESYEEYKEAIIKDAGKLQDLMNEKTGYLPKAFIYPYGFSCVECVSILKEMGFLVTLTCDVGINHLHGKPEELYELKRINRPTDISSNQFFSQIIK